MPGKNKSNELRSDDQPAAPESFDLESILAIGYPVELPIVEGNYEPVPVRYGDVTVSVRRAFTGKEVVTAAKLLVYHNLPVPPELATADARAQLSTEERIRLMDKQVEDSMADFNAHVVRQIGSMLESDNAYEFWEAIKDLPKSIADRLLSEMYKIAGLADAQGEFLAL